jgi:hypothetical protein
MKEATVNTIILAGVIIILIITGDHEGGSCEYYYPGRGYYNINNYR